MADTAPKADTPMSAEDLALLDQLQKRKATIEWNAAEETRKATLASLKPIADLAKAIDPVLPLLAAALEAAPNTELMAKLDRLNLIVASDGQFLVEWMKQYSEPTPNKPA